MKILVTGGAGFIGSNFIHQILQQYPGDEIVNYDLLTYAGNLENLKRVEDDSRYSFVQGDICNREALQDAARGVDAIVHFAAESHVDRSIYSSDEFLQTNIIGTQTVIDVVRELQIPKLVHISTDEVYGDVKAPEKSHENSRIYPSSPYSAAKAGSDMLVIAAIRTHQVPAMITRGSNNYGPFQFPEKIIPLFITNAMTDNYLPLYDGGTQIRDWLYVADHCSGIDTVLRKGKIGEIYNIGAEQYPEITNEQLTHMILELVGKEKQLIKPVQGLRPGHDQRYSLNAAKLRALGWQPSVTIEEGLKRTVQWYQENQDWWERVKSGAYQEYYKKHYR